MLRAVWKPRPLRYKLLEIPVDTLRLLERASFQPVARRAGRQSLGGDVYEAGDLVFHAHFDGSDGKCSIRAFPVNRCMMLLEWDRGATRAGRIELLAPLKISEQCRGGGQVCAKIGPPCAGARCRRHEDGRLVRFQAPARFDVPQDSWP